MNLQRYTLPAILLHWAQAILLPALFWLGWTMTELPKGAERSAAYGLHKSLGLLMLLLVIGRLAWRQRHPAPPLLEAGRAAVLARLTHVGLYGFLLLVPLAGYLASSFTPYTLKFFGLEMLKLGWPDESLNAVFKGLHQAGVWGGLGLIALHVAGAVKNTRKDKAALSRMLPGRLFKK